jgi:hypothetical protein
MLIFVPGCASLDRVAATTFEPINGANNELQFRFTAKSDIIYPGNTADGRRIRMEWLNTWLENNRGQTTFTF